MHRTIKRFEIDGEILDNNSVLRLKESYISILKEQMKLRGYVVRLDIDPEFSLSYNGTSYNFKLSLYGSYVGKKQAECLEAIYGVKGIFTPQNKSEELSNKLA